jgi:hypothetical protein
MGHGRILSKNVISAYSNFHPISARYACRLNKESKTPMTQLLNAASLVSEVGAANPIDALTHFEQLLTFETDCWDVHEAMKEGNSDFVLLDVRGPQSFKTGHLPGATSLPHGKINQRNLSSYPVDTVCRVLQRAALQRDRPRGQESGAPWPKGQKDDRWY